MVVTLLQSLLNVQIPLFILGFGETKLWKLKLSGGGGGLEQVRKLKNSLLDHFFVLHVVVTLL